MGNHYGQCGHDLNLVSLWAAAQFLVKGMTLHEHTIFHMKWRAISCDQVTRELIEFSASIRGCHSTRSGHSIGELIEFLAGGA